MARTRGVVAACLRKECLREGQDGPGLLSRALVALYALRDTRWPAFARRAFETGSYPDAREVAGHAPQALRPENLQASADGLINETFSEEQRQRQIESAKRIIAPDKLLRVGRAKR